MFDWAATRQGTAQRSTQGAAAKLLSQATVYIFVSIDKFKCNCIKSTSCTFDHMQCVFVTDAIAQIAWTYLTRQQFQSYFIRLLACDEAFVWCLLRFQLIACENVRFNEKCSFECDSGAIDSSIVWNRTALCHIPMEMRLFNSTTIPKCYKYIDIYFPLLYWCENSQYFRTKNERTTTGRCWQWPLYVTFSLLFLSLSLSLASWRLFHFFVVYSFFSLSSDYST